MGRQTLLTLVNKPAIGVKTRTSITRLFEPGVVLNYDTPETAPRLMIGDGRQQLALPAYRCSLRAYSEQPGLDHHNLCANFGTFI